MTTRPFMLTRREAVLSLTATALAGIAGVGIVSPASAQQSFSTEALAVAGPLGDAALGPADAKVTIIEYASLTCSHCATFHATTYPALKEKYVDTGKVRFILREFPLDPLAIAGFMLARANNSERYYPITDLLFDRQRTWAFTEKPLDALFETVKQAGFSQESFEATLKDQNLYQGILQVRERAEKEFAVNSTPTFFVNGQKLLGAQSIDQLSAVIDPLLAN